jgi:hypothetical protein
MRLELRAAHINRGAAWTCPSLDYAVHDSLHCGGYKQVETLHEPQYFSRHARESSHSRKVKHIHRHMGLTCINIGQLLD